MVWLLGPPKVDLPLKGRDFGSIPAGHVALVRDILRRVKSEASLARRLAREYNAIVDVLLEAGVPFRILNLASSDTAMARRLRAEKFPSLDLPVESLGPYSCYPRDLFLCLAHARMLLLHPQCFRASLGDRGRFETARSQWAEGGRVLFRDDRMVVPKHPERAQPRCRNMLDRLKARGMRIATVPAAISLTLGSAGETVLSHYEPHIDRSASLIRGKDGGLSPAVGSGLPQRPIALALECG